MKTAENLGLMLKEEAIHISKAAALEKITGQYIVFVYPVHNYDMPHMVQNFIKSIEIEKSAFYAGIITHGGDKGNALFTLKDLLANKGINLHYGNDLLMPVNSRIMYGMVTDKIEERLNNSEEKLKNQIATDIHNGINNANSIRKNRIVKAMTNIVDKPFLRSRFTPSVQSENCISCGICQKVCPVDNVVIREEGAFIETHCEACLTCMHWCPEVAIGFGKRTVKKEQQYHHPDVRVKKMIKVLK
jgi:Pyruvate/2-oxoacid:ferredoxin oxidoreductase delta subunit